MDLSKMHATKQQEAAQARRIANLETELAEAYRKIETLSNSDKELQAAQRHEANAIQSEQNAQNKLDNASLKLKEAKQQEEQNRQKEKQLQEQAKKLAEREKQLETTITAAKEQAAKDARAELDAERGQLIKEQQALDAAQKDADRAKQKACDDTIRNNEALIRVLTIFCGVVGIIEVIKHTAVINIYMGWYIWLAAKTSSMAAVGIIGLVWVVPLLGYFCPSNPLWMAYRLIAIIGMLMLADFVQPSTAAIIIYIAGWLIAGGRLYISKIDKGGY